MLGQMILAIKKITTNSWGFRSQELSPIKQPNELRFAFIGDSVTYGHGVASENRFSDVFNQSFAQKCPSHPITTINTGVPGYSIRHEYFDFVSINSLKPDVVILQFTLNDLTEPFSFEKRLGGAGLDYHQVADTTWWHFYLSQRSALYLFFNDLSKQLRFGTKNDTDIQHKAGAIEVLRDTEFTNQPNTEKHQPYWDEYYRWFDQFAAECQRQKTTCVLLLSPYKFQLSQDHSKAYPQLQLAAYAQSKGLSVIDVIPVFQTKIAEQAKIELSLDTNPSIEYLHAQYPTELDKFAGQYYIDYDHYSPLGHTVIADTLTNFFSSMCLNN